MILAITAVTLGLLLLIWSADRFVDGAAATAQYFNVPPLLIGMLIVGFGTSAPEIVVSIISALQGASGIAIGNAYGSNITNIALILGITALISPILVESRIIKVEMPVLLAITLLSALLLYDSQLSRFDGFALLAVFLLITFLSILNALKQKQSVEVNVENPPQKITLALTWLIIGLILLIISSQALVWGATHIAEYFGVSQLVIGLTVVAIGTSLPELASSIAAARKQQHDLALGNIIGSNLFNTLMVVGITGALRPINVENEVFSRDIVIMSGLTLLLFLFILPYGKKSQIQRWQGLVFLFCYLSYNLYLLHSAVAN